VHAFEPINKLCSQIRKSVEVNKFTNFKVHTFALGNKESDEKIYLRDENMGGSSLAEYKDLNLVSVSSAETIKVVTLDSQFRHDTKVDVIKIDVEGYELEAFKGAYKLLKAQHPVIFMEFSPIFYNQDYPDKSMDLIKFLKDLNYSFETMTGTSINLEEWLRDTSSPYQIDVICK
jgi:FkbM family methyltransferase